MDNFYIKSDFQFEKYINERLQEIGDEGERRALKEIVRETIIPFYEHSENAYHALERNLLQGQERNDNGYEIITGIEHRQKVDITDDTMFPMQYKDLNDTVIDVKKLRQHIARGVAYKVMQIFLKLDYRDIKILEKSSRVFQGIVKVEYGEYPAKVIIKRNTSYLEQISELYNIFEENGVEWRTPCTPYLRKFFDVYIVDSNCPEEEEIIGINIDFEEYEDCISYDMIPLWNIRHFEESTSAYPAFAFDQIHYEHCIFGNRINSNNDYLVCAKEQKLWEVFRKDGDLYIVCDEEEPLRWELIEIVRTSKKKSYNFPTYGNVSNSKKEIRCIHTKAEITKYIGELGYAEYLKLIDIKHSQSILDNETATYCIDDFIEDEIRTSTHRQYLILRFKAINSGFYLNKDIMSYLVSRIQWKIPEFKCVGELE